MKNVFRNAVVGAAAAAFVASVAVAGGQVAGDQKQQPQIEQGRRGPGGAGFGRGGRGGPLGGVMAELTDQQREQVRAILTEERQDGQRAGDMKLRQALELELLADQPNLQKVEELKQQIVSAHSESLTRHIAVQQKINQILTAEQRAKARERIGQRGEGRRAERPGLRH